MIPRIEAMTDAAEIAEPKERRAWSVGQFCAAYSICRATFYNEVRRGRLQIVKLGSKTLVLNEDAEKWVSRLRSSG